MTDYLFWKAQNLCCFVHRLHELTYYNNVGCGGSKIHKIIVKTLSKEVVNCQVLAISPTCVCYVVLIVIEFHILLHCVCVGSLV